MERRSQPRRGQLPVGQALGKLSPGALPQLGAGGRASLSPLHRWPSQVARGVWPATRRRADGGPRFGRIEDSEVAGRGQPPRLVGRTAAGPGGSLSSSRPLLGPASASCHLQALPVCDARPASPPAAVLTQARGPPLGRELGQSRGFALSTIPCVSFSLCLRVS